MPAYGTRGSTAINSGDQVVLFGTGNYQGTFAAETIVAGAKSISVAIAPSPVGAQPALSVELAFSGAPGAFELDIQVADTDVDANYILNTATAFKITSVVNNVARAEFLTNARFLRLYMPTLTNAVNTLATVTRY